MEQYIFYNTTTGDIFYAKNLKHDGKADELVTKNPSFPMAWKKATELTGLFLSERSQKLDLTTTPFSIVKRPSEKMKAYSLTVKEQRNARLLAGDWTQGADSPLSDAKKLEWQTYRQALRDLSYSGLNHGDTVTWPTEPS